MNACKTDKNIENLASSIALKRNLEDYLEQLKPASIALDKVQGRISTIRVFFPLKKRFEKRIIIKRWLFQN